MNGDKHVKFWSNNVLNVCDGS